MSYNRYGQKTTNPAIFAVILVPFIIVISIIVSVFFMIQGGIDYSNGERHGIVSKLSYKGFFCPTWEGEMNLGGFKNVTSTDKDGNSSSSIVANIFEFSVSNEKIAQQIQEKLNQGAPVTLVYDQILFRNPCAGSTGYDIVEVK